MQDYEKLGSFYLGRRFDPERNQPTDDLLLYDSKDLTTHAVCVGMTGSGKTGLCISLLEEAAIDGIPAICIDPKGDLGNLLLNFPALQPSDFAPWIDEGEAARKGMSVADYAGRTAETWSKGLAEWAQEPARIQKLRDAADMAIYTPGSNAGLPLTILRSFSAPSAAARADADALRDRIMAAVSGLLALLGVDADPIQSREHILLSNIFDRAWKEGRDMELASLIREIQKPPFEKLGVFDLESFYPEKDRFALAMRLNNMLASPGFEAWLQGEPLDIQRLLYASDGRPRLSILSIAHLSDAERMFFVTLLLNETVAWMRAQPGTSSLRAILYMDEIFGYFPPTANPPSKIPMLTLLKQARAFGLGCVLATQNPVDLDYKGLSNTGTWFIGRLQTERDKMRVLDGLEGASGSAGKAFDRAGMEATLAGLGNRVFLMNNVHDDQPVLLQTRWALSYLRGPLTRTQIEKLMAGRKSSAEALSPASPSSAAPAASTRPTLPPTVGERFLPPKTPAREDARLVYRPHLFATAKLHFVDAKSRTDLWHDVTFLAPLPDQGNSVAWEESRILQGLPPASDAEPAASAEFTAIPSPATVDKNYDLWAKMFASHLYQAHTLTLFHNPGLKEYSRPAETEGDFRARLSQRGREARNADKEKLQKRYAPKLEALQQRIRKAEQKVEVERSQFKEKTMHTVLSMGTTLLGAFLGRKTLSAGTISRASTTMRTAGRVSREKDDIGRAEENVEALKQQLEELESQFRQEVDAMQSPMAPADLQIEALNVRPRKSDIMVGEVCLAWAPWQVDASGIATPLF